MSQNSESQMTHIFVEIVTVVDDTPARRNREVLTEASDKAIVSFIWSTIVLTGSLAADLSRLTVLHF